MWSGIGSSMRSLLRGSEFPEIDTSDLGATMGGFVQYYMGTIIFMGVIVTMAVLLLFYVVLGKCCKCCCKRKLPTKPAGIPAKITLSILLLGSVIVMVCGMMAGFTGQTAVRRSAEIFAASGASVLEDGGSLVYNIEPVIDDALEYSITSFSAVSKDFTTVVDGIIAKIDAPVKRATDQLRELDTQITQLLRKSESISRNINTAGSLMDSIESADSDLDVHLVKINSILTDYYNFIGASGAGSQTNWTSPGFSNVFDSGLKDLSQDDPASDIPEFPNFDKIILDIQSSISSIDTKSIEVTVSEGILRTLIDH